MRLSDSGVIKGAVFSIDSTSVCLALPLVTWAAEELLLGYNTQGNPYFIGAD